MANYKITDYTTAPQGSIADVTALLETKLETLDSTTNPLYHKDILKLGSLFQGTLIYGDGQAEAGAGATVSLTPNGVNDNVQIQAAIDSLGAAGGKIQLSAGTFVCLATINMLGASVNYIAIEGCGDSTLIDFRTTGWVDGFNIQGAANNEVYKVKLRNFRIVEGAGGEINDGIYQKWVSDGSVENVRIEGCTHGIHCNSCYNHNLIGVVADDNTYYGIKLVDCHDMGVIATHSEANGNHGVYSENCKNISFTGVISEDNTEDGFHITTRDGEQSYASVTISGGSTDGNRDGVRITGINNISITGHTFGGNVSNEIHLINSHRNTIVGNNIQSGACPVKFVNSSENKVMGNVMSHNTTISEDSYSYNNIIEQGLEGDVVFAYGTPVTIEDCEDVWVAKANVTAATDATHSGRMVGARSSKLTVAAAFTTGLIATEDFGAIDLSRYLWVGFWIKSSIDIAADVLQICLDNTAACASPLKTLNIPALTANDWQYVKLSLGNPASLTATISVGINAASDPGACTIWIDQITTEKPKVWYDASAGEFVLGEYAKVYSHYTSGYEKTLMLEGTQSVRAICADNGFFDVYDSSVYQLSLKISDGRLTAKGGFRVAGLDNAHIDDATHGDGSTTLYIGNETIDTTPVSDEKYKEDVKDTVCSITDLEKIAVRDFRFTAAYTKDNSVQIGMVAQEVQKVFPYAVKENHFKGGDTAVAVESTEALNSGELKAGYYKDKDDTYYKMENIPEEKVLVVDYKKIIPLLIKSVQDLNDKIKILEAK